mgnify:CR=1 FL=1
MVALAYLALMETAPTPPTEANGDLTSSVQVFGYIKDLKDFTGTTIAEVSACIDSLTPHRHLDTVS